MGAAYLHYADIVIGAGAVEWDETLATFARDYAPICQMVHS
jgi:hypothetical protein